MTENKGTFPTGPENDKSSNPLSDEQEEALKKIMAELEGKNSAEEASSESKDATEQKQESQTNNGLTDEQEAALQKIMAEIETSTKGAAPTKPSPQNTSITAEQEETLNKIVAELQGSVPLDNEKVSEDLSQDQEETLKKIMAEIEGGASSKSADSHDPGQDTDTDSSLSESTAVTADGGIQASATESVKESEKSKSSGGFEELDLSSFESELQKVVAEANIQSAQAQTPKRRFTAGLGQQGEETPESVTSKDSNEIVSVSEAPPPEKTTSQDPSEDLVEEEPTPALEDSINSPEPQSAEESDEPEPVDAPTAAPVQIKAPPLKEVPKRPSSAGKRGIFKKLILISICSAAVALLAAAAVWYWHLPKQPSHKELTAVSPDSIENRNGSVNSKKTEDDAADNSAPESGLTQIQNNTLTKISEDIGSLKKSLLDKLKEINDLKKYYQQGIRETEEDLISLIGNKNIKLLKEAIEDQQIELGLRTIQRRKEYISRLTVPYDQVLKDSEELLYLERKAEIFREMMRNTSGISLDSFEKQVIETLRRVSIAKASLSIDQAAPPDGTLEIVWNDLYAKAGAASRKKLTSVEQAKLNQTIWKEICSGNFNRKYVLTELNEKTAQCLLQWDGKDLYLNNLTSITPEVAQILSHWPGEWLGLNGLLTLPPEVARHLSRWKGKRLSLNGLTELSPKATLYLSKWQGNQLELVGLKHIGQWENPKIELFVSDKLRNQIPR